MPKNIVIFSDGTGQRAGLTFDERRSNVYKLFRAARSGPDSQIDPSEQVTFYDAGVGTAAPGASLVGRLWVWVFNLISRATGLGLTTNVVETYAAIIREWEEGDRIFLFGFSRGAYTMRLLGGVLSLCGVPTKQPDGSLRIDGKGSKKIARRAVTRVYQHAASKVGTAENPLSEKQKMYLDQRRLLAEAFREEYGSFDKNAPEQSNTVPHFIGVYDTVASLFHPAASALIAVAAVIVLAVISLGLTFFGAPFWQSFLSLIGLVTTFSGIWFLGKNLKIPGKIGPYSAWQTTRLTGYMHFEDTELSPRVPYARHAISIDEVRAQFQRVPWNRQGEANEPDADGTIPFKQVWFAGVHTDIGGGYPEAESRLSDTTLLWILEDVEKAEIGLKIDRTFLNLFPLPHGRQHDEYAANFFWRLAGRKVRDIPTDAPLHPSVESRYRAAAVKHYDKLRPYRPENLQGHQAVIGWK